MARSKVQSGNCYICGVELSKISMKNHILKVHNQNDGEDCFLLKVEYPYDKNFWLYIDIPKNKTLQDLDQFLRDIWLECCGHLSAFTYQNDEMDMSLKLGYFSVGDKINHEYDFGSTTETVITVISEIKRIKNINPVRLLSRNIPLEFKCNECENDADYICIDCMYEDCDNPFYCETCSEDHEHEETLLPVTNSPRMGVCGYTGGNPAYEFDPSKFNK